MCTNRTSFSWILPGPAVESLLAGWLAGRDDLTWQWCVSCRGKYLQKRRAKKLIITIIKLHRHNQITPDEHSSSITLRFLNDLRDSSGIELMFSDVLPELCRLWRVGQFQLFCFVTFPKQSYFLLKFKSIRNVDQSTFDLLGKYSSESHSQQLVVSSWKQTAVTVPAKCVGLTSGGQPKKAAISRMINHI